MTAAAAAWAAPDALVGGCARPSDPAGRRVILIRTRKPASLPATAVSPADQRGTGASSRCCDPDRRRVVYVTAEKLIRGATDDGCPRSRWRADVATMTAAGARRGDVKRIEIAIGA
jgi:hypothetical protein